MFCGYVNTRTTKVTHFNLSLCFFLILTVLLLNACAFKSNPDNFDQKNGILLAAFGTSEPKALVSYDAIAEEYEHLDLPVVWAYTSNIIRDKLTKQGKERPATPEEALNILAQQGVKNVRVQPLLMVSGEEYNQLQLEIYAAVLKKPHRFHSVYMARPLLESERDMNEVIQAVLNDIAPNRNPDDAVVLMAHGHKEGRADLPLVATYATFQKRDPLVFLATVEGSLGFDSVLQSLKAKQIKKVWLAPLMIVAGDHACNDLVGTQKKSWASQLKAEWIQALFYLKGLGEIAGIRQIFMRHTLETKDDLLQVRM